MDWRACGLQSMRSQRVERDWATKHRYYQSVMQEFVNNEIFGLRNQVLMIAYLFLLKRDIWTSQNELFSILIVKREILYKYGVHQIHCEVFHICLVLKRIVFKLEFKIISVKFIVDIFTENSFFPSCSLIKAQRKQTRYIFFLNTSFNILESGLADMQINWRKPLFLGWRWFSRRYQIDRARRFTEKWAHCIHNATRATSWWRKGPVTQVQVPGMVLKLFGYNLIAWSFATISRYVYWSFVKVIFKMYSVNWWRWIFCGDNHQGL